MAIQFASVDSLVCDQEVLELLNVDYTDLLGKPFRLGARGPEYYDCWGLCLELGKRAGIEYPADFTPEKKQSKYSEH